MRKLACFVAVVAATTCGEVAEPTFPEDRLSNGIFLFAPLDADSVRHWVQVSPLDERAEGFAATVTIHERTSSSAGSGWRLLGSYSAEALPRGTIIPISEQKPCRPGPDTHWNSLCMGPEAVLKPGGTYMVRAVAEGYVPASGVATVPGDFEVTAAELSSRDGAHTIEAAWSRADDAPRYLLGIRRIWIDCINCSRAWTVSLDSTSFSGPVPQAVVDSMGTTPTVEVMAADEHFHAFVTSGLGARLLTVHPIQNVEGGFGVVGSVRYRTRRIVVSGGAGRYAGQVEPPIFSPIPATHSRKASVFGTHKPVSPRFR